MERLHVQLPITGFIVDERERHELVTLCPFCKPNKHPSRAGIPHKVSVLSVEKILSHPFDLGREDVLHAIVEILDMVALAAKLERSHKSILGKDFQIVGRCLGNAARVGLHRDRVREPHHPDVGRVRRPLQVPVLMNVKQLRVEPAAVQHKLGVRHALQC